MKRFFENLKGGLGFGLGILLTIFIGGVLASLNSVEQGDTLTADKWNELVGSVSNLNSEIQVLKNENVSMNGEIKNFKNESISFGGLNDNIEILRNEIDSLKNQNSSANSNIASLNTEIQTLKNQNASLNSLIPKGAIIAFNSSSCPSGWNIANNLKDRFIVGAGNSYGIGATGGSTATTGTIGQTALDINQIPNHSHTIYIYNTNHTHGGVIPGGTLYLKGGYGEWTDYPINGVPFDPAGFTSHLGGGGFHTHTYTGGSNLPPFVAYIYCIKE